MRHRCLACVGALATVMAARASAGTRRWTGRGGPLDATTYTVG